MKETCERYSNYLHLSIRNAQIRSFQTFKTFMVNMKQYWQFMPYNILKDTNQLSETKQFVSVIFYVSYKVFSLG